MALVDLWNSERSQITSKRLEQLIAFAGEGKLKDANDTSTELRELLSITPSDLLGQWIEECLTERFTDFGFVLQDIVNEIGNRLGFEVTPGVYRGKTGEGYDGLWTIPGERAIVVESKSSTAYSINLSTIAAYRKQVEDVVDIPAEGISILIVVGTDTTDDLEAQVRGSRYAWNIRLLGVRSLFRLLKLKEALDDLNVERQIKEILVPQEFTRIDRIIDLVFATAEDTQSIEDDTDTENELNARATPSSFHDVVLPKLEKHFGKSLIKQGRVLWASPDNEVLVSCQVSKEYSGTEPHYWFGLKNTTQSRLDQHGNAYCAFALGDAARVILIKFSELKKYLDQLNISVNEDGSIIHWHVRFIRRENSIELVLNQNSENHDVSSCLLT